VDLLSEIFRALLMAALPIGVFTFVLVWWALRGGHFTEALDANALEGEMKAMVETRKKSKRGEKTKQHPVQKKWASFGGGFYGVVAFFTYTVIEVRDIADTIMSFGGIGDFLRQLDIGLFVDMFIEALMNFIWAMAWPAYWISSIDAAYVWVWFPAAYLGYWQGMKLAQREYRRRQGTENG